MVVVELLRCVLFFWDPMDYSPSGFSVHASLVGSAAKNMPVMQEAWFDLWVGKITIWIHYF